MNIQQAVVALCPVLYGFGEPAAGRPLAECCGASVKIDRLTGEQNGDPTRGDLFQSGCLPHPQEPNFCQGCCSLAVGSSEWLLQNVMDNFAHRPFISEDGTPLYWADVNSVERYLSTCSTAAASDIPPLCASAVAPG